MAAGEEPKPSSQTALESQLYHFTSCVLLGKLLNLSVPHSSPFKDGDDDDDDNNSSIYFLVLRELKCKALWARPSTLKVI